MLWPGFTDAGGVGSVIKGVAAVRAGEKSLVEGEAVAVCEGAAAPWPAASPSTRGLLRRPWQRLTSVACRPSKIQSFCRPLPGTANTVVPDSNTAVTLILTTGRRVQTVTPGLTGLPQRSAPFLAQRLTSETVTSAPQPCTTSSQRHQIVVPVILFLPISDSKLLHPQR